MSCAMVAGGMNPIKKEEDRRSSNAQASTPRRRSILCTIALSRKETQAFSSPQKMLKRHLESGKMRRTSPIRFLERGIPVSTP